MEERKSECLGAARAERPPLLNKGLHNCTTLCLLRVYLLLTIRRSAMTSRSTSSRVL